MTLSIFFRIIVIVLHSNNNCNFRSILTGVSAQTQSLVKRCWPLQARAGQCFGQADISVWSLPKILFELYYQKVKDESFPRIFYLHLKTLMPVPVRMLVLMTGDQLQLTKN